MIMTSSMEIILLLLTKAFGKRRYATVVVCLTLMAFGIKNKAIHDKLGISYAALRKYKDALGNGKIAALLEFKGIRTESKLNDYENIIQGEFDANPPKTLREAQERILKLTGLKRSLHRTRVWLKKKGIKTGR